MQAASDAKPAVLIVDDSPDNIAIISSLLKETYRVKAATSGELALSLVSGSTPPRPRPPRHRDAGHGRL